MTKQFPANTILEVQPDARPGVSLVHVETADCRQTLFSVPAKFEALITEMVLAHNEKINAGEGRWLRMNTLRKLEADWRADAKNAYANGRYFQMCARDLSSAIPAWERVLEKADHLANCCEFPTPDSNRHKAAQELREALEGVKAK